MKRRKNDPRIKEMTKAALKQVANIIGSNSAAQQAIAEMDARQARGEDVVCYVITGCPMFWVGPRIPHPGDDNAR